MELQHFRNRHLQFWRKIERDRWKTLKLCGQLYYIVGHFPPLFCQSNSDDRLYSWFHVSQKKVLEVKQWSQPQAARRGCNLQYGLLGPPSSHLLILFYLLPLPRSGQSKKGSQLIYIFGKILFLYGVNLLVLAMNVLHLRNV